MMRMAPSALIRNAFHFSGRVSAGIGDCTRRTPRLSRTMGTARASGVSLFVASFSTVFYFCFVPAAGMLSWATPAPLV